jgi:ribosomal protein S18 acetylase RimI-like enzyme
MPAFDLQPVSAPGQVDAVRSLFRAHAESLQYYGPSFVHFEGEMDALPAPYDQPGNRLYLAVMDGQGMGCVGVQRLNADTCQMKRLYVMPESRELNIGKALIEQAIGFAKDSGYRYMRLTTAPDLERAIGLYQRYGFVFVEPNADEKAYGKLAMQLDLWSEAGLQA